VNSTIHKTKKQLNLIMPKKQAKKHADKMRAQGAPNATKRRRQNQKNNNIINPLRFAFSKADAR
jgi:hypothetical protein